MRSIANDRRIPLHDNNYHSITTRLPFKLPQQQKFTKNRFNNNLIVTMIKTLK